SPRKRSYTLPKPAVSITPSMRFSISNFQFSIFDWALGIVLWIHRPNRKSKIESRLQKSTFHELAGRAGVALRALFAAISRRRSALKRFSPAVGTLRRQRSRDRALSLPRLAANSAQALPDTQRRDDDYSEHKMAHDLGSSAHAHGAPAKAVFEPAVDSFTGAAFAKATALGLIQRLPVAPLFRLDDGNMTQAARI